MVDGILPTPDKPPWKFQRTWRTPWLPILVLGRCFGSSRVRTGTPSSIGSEAQRRLRPEPDASSSLWRCWPGARPSTRKVGNRLRSRCIRQSQRSVHCLAGSGSTCLRLSATNAAQSSRPAEHRSGSTERSWCRLNQHPVRKSHRHPPMQDSRNRAQALRLPHRIRLQARTRARRSRHHNLAREVLAGSRSTAPNAIGSGAATNELNPPTDYSGAKTQPVITL